VGPFFYLALRNLSLGVVSSSFGVLSFIGGLYFNIQAGYDPYAMFIYPVILWAVTGILRKQIKLSYLVLLWGALGLNFGFDIEQDFYFLSAVFLFAPFLAKPDKWKRVLILGIGVGFAILFELSPLINLAAYSHQSIRSAGITFRNYIGSGGAPDFKMLLPVFLFPSPDKFGVLYQSFYPGLVCLLMVFLGAKRLGWKGFLSFLVLILFGLYAINWGPLCKFLFHIPVVNKLALHYSSALVFYLGLSVLGSFGVEEFLEKRTKGSLSALVIIILFILVSVFIVSRDWVRFIGLLIVLGIALGLLFRRLKKEWLWQVLVMLAVVFDVSYLAFKLQPRARKNELEDSSAVLNFLRQERNLVRFLPLSRHLHEDTLVHPLVGMNLPLDLPGTHSPLGYWRMPTLRLAKLLNFISPGYLKLDSSGKLDFLDPDPTRDPKEIDESDLFYLRLFNVGNIIVRGAKLDVEGIDFLASVGDIHFYRLKETMPRYYLVSEIKEFTEPEKILELIAQKGFDPLKTALVENKLNFVSSDYNAGRVFLKKYLPGKWELVLDLPEMKPGAKSAARYFLVIGESYVPGWRAFSGKKELRVYRANYGFFGVPLKPGIYDLKIVYRPFQTRIGLWSGFASISFWLVIGIGFLINSYWAKKRLEPS